MIRRLRIIFLGFQLKLALWIVLMVVAGNGIKNPACAQTHKMLVTSQYNDSKPQTLIWKRFHELIEAKLPGRFALRIVTDGAFGGEKEEAEAILLGTITGSLSTIANLTSWVPEGALFDMPFLFRDAAHIKDTVSGPLGAEFKERYAKIGFKILGFVTFGARHLIAKIPVLQPENIKNKRMRVLQSRLHVDLWRSLGVNPVPIPITEAYSALDTGLVDLMDMTMSGYEALKLYEVAPYFNQTAHIWALGVMYMGHSFWDKLTHEEQEIISQAAKTSIAYFNQQAAEEQNLSLERAKMHGAKIIKPDLSAWKKAMAAFWKDYGPKVGGIDRIHAIAHMK